MSEKYLSDLQIFQNTVIGLLSYDELLDFAIPALHVYLKSLISTRLNLSLAVEENNQAPFAGSGAMLRFLPNGYARDFGTARSYMPASL